MILPKIKIIVKTKNNEGTNKMAMAATVQLTRNCRSLYFGESAHKELSYILLVSKPCCFHATAIPMLLRCWQYCLSEYCHHSWCGEHLTEQMAAFHTFRQIRVNGYPPTDGMVVVVVVVVVAQNHTEHNSAKAQRRSSHCWNMRWVCKSI